MLKTEERKLVLAAANRTLFEKGIARVSLADVAEEAGIDMAEIKAAFPSLRDLLRELVQWGMDDFNQFFSNILTKRGKPDLKVRHLITGILQRLDRHYLVYKMMSIALGTPVKECHILRKVASEEDIEVYLQHIRIIARIFAKGQSENLFVRTIDPLAAAYMLSGMMVYIIRFKEESQGSFAIADYAKAIIRIFLRGFYR